MPQVSKGPHSRVREIEFRLYVILSAILLLSIVFVKQDVLVRLESGLATHMIVEHAIFFALGALSVMAAETILRMLSLRSSEAKSRNGSRAAMRLWSRVLRAVFGTVPGYVWLGAAVGLMAFWHLPHFFVEAVLYPQVHILQHLSFAAVGSAGFIATRMLGDSLRIVLLLLIIGMMGLAGLLFSVLSSPIYPVYTVADHNSTGGYMVLVSTALLLVALPAYLIRRSMAYVRATQGATGESRSASAP